MNARPDTGTNTQSRQPRESSDVAASAALAGAPAVSTPVSALPSRFLADVVIVQHLDPKYRSLVADVPDCRVALKVKQADERGHLHPATACIAPPDHYLLISENASLSLSHSELVYAVRPLAGLPFESVSASHESQAANDESPARDNGLDGLNALLQSTQAGNCAPGWSQWTYRSPGCYGTMEHRACGACQQVRSWAGPSLACQWDSCGGQLMPSRV